MLLILLLLLLLLLLRLGAALRLLRFGLLGLALLGILALLLVLLLLVLLLRILLLLLLLLLDLAKFLEQFERGLRIGRAVLVGRIGCRGVLEVGERLLDLLDSLLQFLRGHGRSLLHRVLLGGWIDRRKIAHRVGVDRVALVVHAARRKIGRRVLRALLEHLSSAGEVALLEAGHA